MAAWNFGPFENDEAGDWLDELEATSDTSAIAEALNHVSDIGGGYLETADCYRAIAAAEILAALLGHPHRELPENARQWVDSHRNLKITKLVALATAAVEHVRDDSELKESWDETDGAPKWYAAMDDLTGRLSS